jgi:hypothetical protein
LLRRRSGEAQNRRKHQAEHPEPLAANLGCQGEEGISDHIFLILAIAPGQPDRP